MSVHQEEFDESAADIVEALSPFRAAFARARLEGVLVTESERPATPKPDGAPGSGKPPSGRFEIRIEKRRGKRSADTRRWNKLGDEGWELVAVVGKEAFFRRIRY